MRRALLSIRFRPFVLADAGPLAGWLASAGLAPPPEVGRDDWAVRLVDDPRIVCCVAVGARAEPLGFYRLDLAPDATAEITLIVAPDRRRRGFGRRMVADALAWGRRHGLRRIVAVVRTDNVAAQEFFAAAGFDDSGRRIPDFVHLERRLHNAAGQSPIEIEV